MRYEFHPDALDEYEDAARYYTGCQDGLELRFITCVESAFRQVSEAPTRWRPFEQDVRQCLVHVFPYAVFYSIESDYALIIAVMHCSRAPGYWLLASSHRPKRLTKKTALTGASAAVTLQRAVVGPVVGGAALLRRTSLEIAASFTATVVDGCGILAAKLREVCGERR